MGNKLFFTAHDPINDEELRWIDTTLVSPTVNTVDINSGRGESRAGHLGGFAVAGTKLYFSAKDSASGYELRWIDAAAESPTVNTLDIYSGIGSSFAGEYGGFKLVGTKLYFSAKDGASGYELRWIDTTAASPTINTIDLYSGEYSSWSRIIAVSGAKLYFSGDDGLTGHELRWIDTSEESPAIHTIEINSGADGSFPGHDDSFKLVGTKLYFNAYDPSNGAELRWIDTSEVSPTVHTIDIYGGSKDSNAGMYNGFRVVGTKLFFFATDAAEGWELRWIDSSLGSPIVNSIDVNSRVDVSIASGGEFIGVSGAKIYLRGYDPANGIELRWIDTSAASMTVNTIDIYPGANSSRPRSAGDASVVGSKLYFSAIDGDVGNELRWIDTEVASPVVNTIDINTSENLAGRRGSSGIH